MANLPIHEPLDFDTKLRKMETSDTDHADNWNVLYERLINNDAFLHDLIAALAGAGRTTETVKSNYDAIMTLHNMLQAVATGASGADYVKMTPIADTGAANTVQSLIQALINKLKASSSGSSGADFIGVSSIPGLSGSTVQAVLASLKTYADAIVTGLDPKASVRVTTTAHITLSGTQVIDSVTLVTGDRVLVKDQTATKDNGIYVVASGSWTRATDADTSAKVTPGMYVFVEEGTANANSGWILTTKGTITLGTTALSFTQFSGAGQITATGGLQKSGNTIYIASNGITDTHIGNRTVDPTLAPSGVVGTITQLFSWIANRIKAITGKANWYDAPATTLEDVNTTLTSATSAVTSNQLMKRDASGRAKVAAPSASDDIARKDTVDAVQTNLNAHRIDTMPHQSIDSATGKIYRWGMGVENGKVFVLYEEVL